MGDSEITIARNYQAGADGRLRMDTLPFTGAYTTYALQETSPSLIDYVTDSAASGTGWATGYKTSNGRISSVAGTGNAVTRLHDHPRARAARRLQDRQRQHRRDHRRDAGGPRSRTSTIAAARVPANMAHLRALSKKENGGPGSIAEQIGRSPRQRRCSAAAWRGSSRSSPVDRTSGRPSSSRRSCRATSRLRCRDAGRRRGRSCARPVQRRQHVARVERAAGDSRSPAAAFPAARPAPRISGPSTSRRSRT